MNGNSPPVPTSAPPKTSALAITSLVLGIIAIVFTVICIGPLFGIPAIICGHLAYSKIKHSSGQLTGQGMAMAGFIAGYVSLAFLVLLLPIAIPNFIKARTTAQKNACINTLRQIDGAKRAWELETRKAKTDVPTKEDLMPYFKDDSFPACPAGGEYTLGTVAEKPTCSIEGHSLNGD